MPPTRRAVIDIGTNSIKVLVAEVSGHQVRPLWEESKQTRLGKGFYETHQLRHEAIYATAHFAAEFANLARSYHVESIRIIATSAARDAVNQAEFVQAVEQMSGLKLDIISGDQEAELAFRGVTSDPALDGQRLCIMDVGGGSAEFIVGAGEQMEFAQSFKLGGVRLLEQFPPSEPPTKEELQCCRQWLREFIAREISPALQPLLSPAKARPILVGVGGAATTLTRMVLIMNYDKRKQIKTEGIPTSTVSEWVENLWGMSLCDRMRLVGLKKKRADIIPFGAAILEAVMLELGFPHLRISKRGIRHAAMQLNG
jgi:exopolyphosphatase/guanosine-5'-triphosphate,3'-diphosphate pyrophosphatase